MKRVVFLTLTSVCVAAVVFFTLGTLATPAHADRFVIQWIDNDDAVGLRVVTTQYDFNDEVCMIQDMPEGSESYDHSYNLWYHPEKGTVLQSSFNLAFNIYDPDGITLSDTWELSGNQGDAFFQSSFISDTEGIPLLPLANATSLTETGQLQTVTSFQVVDNSGLYTEYTLQFVSDIGTTEVPEPVPEPATMLLLGLGLVGLAGVRRKFKK